MGKINNISELPKKEIITEIDGRKLKLSNLSKVLYPKLGITKAEFIQYYLKIAPYILPHLKNRPLTLIRYPDGIEGKRFYSKNKPNWTPNWIKSKQLDKEDDNIYVMVNNTPSLAWVANLAALELHPMLIRAKAKKNPDHIIFDLDPPKTSKFKVVKELALKLKPFLESYGYHPFLKTSGGKGLHIYVPIVPKYTQETVLEAIKDLATKYIQIDKTTTLKLNKEKREGKVLLDIYRNHKSQTCVAPYSTRGKPGAPVSTPLFWDELPELKSSQTYTLHTIFDKLEDKGDPWENFEEHQVVLHTDQSQSTDRNKPFLGKNDVPIENINLSPMLATLGKSIPPKSDYIYEIKWDGIRTIITKDKQKVSIISRNGNDLTSKFPEISKRIKKQPLESFIIDGELIILGKSGKPNFSKIVSRMHLKGKSSIALAAQKDKATFYVFDQLYAEGRDIRKYPLEKRRKFLENNLEWSETIRYSSEFKDGKELLQAITSKGMEGIMCKKKGSFYSSNTRSSHWLKIKVQNEDQALIIGYTKGKGDRKHLFGSLHLAKKKKEGFQYLGKVGTGFDHSKMKQIASKLGKVPTTKKPIKEKIDEENNTVWIKPEYICAIKYASLSSNNTYREPVFLSMQKSTE